MENITGISKEFSALSFSVKMREDYYRKCIEKGLSRTDIDQE
jgi:hypothetical protein